MLNDENNHLARELDSRTSREDEIGRLTLELESTRMELAVCCPSAYLYRCYVTDHGLLSRISEVFFICVLQAFPYVATCCSSISWYSTVQNQQQHYLMIFPMWFTVSCDAAGA